MYKAYITTYRGTGRPATFQIVDLGSRSQFKLQRKLFYEVKEGTTFYFGKFRNYYQAQNCLCKMTMTDSDGYTQWSKLGQSQR